MNEKHFVRPVTMRRIAEAAGVSQPTVSRALRNDPRISKKTRERVKQLSEELGYRPNPFVSALMSQVHPYRRARGHASIAVLDCWPSGISPFWLQQYREGITERASQLGYKPEQISFHDMANEPRQVHKVLTARGIRGLLVLPVPYGTDLTGLDFSHLAGATIDFSLKEPKLNRSAPDYFEGMRLALNRLTERGYHRIGFCTHKGENTLVGSRWQGALMVWQSQIRHKDRLAMHVNSFDQLHAATLTMRKAEEYWADKRDEFARWLKRCNPEVVLSNDFFFFDWLRGMGVDVPGEIRFASLSVDPDPREQSRFRGKETSRTRETLTGINQHHRSVGAAAVDLIVGQFNRNDYGLSHPEKTVLIESRWSNGDTA